MKISTTNFNQVLNELEAEVEHRGDRVELWENADTVVLWQDVMGTARDVAIRAKNRGKRVLTYEHGLLSINDYIPPLSKPMISDIYMTWGEKTKKWLVEKARIPEEKITVTGATLFSRLGPRLPHEGKRVLFAPRHWEYHLPENLEVAELLKKYDKAHVYSKLVVGEHDPDLYPDPIITHRHNSDHIGNCYEALKDADVVVGIGEGTFASLAYWMDIPYISVDNWGEHALLGKTYTREEFNSQLSYACRLVKPEGLLDAIDEELSRPDALQGLRKQFIDEYLDGGDPQKALQKQLDVVYAN